MANTKTGTRYILPAQKGYVVIYLLYKRKNRHASRALFFLVVLRQAKVEHVDDWRPHAHGLTWSPMVQDNQRTVFFILTNEKCSKKRPFEGVPIV